jgi:chloramphenicol O-acetyltransferase type B
MISIKSLFRKKQKPSKFERLTRRFKRDYPQFEIGRGSYGVPFIHPSHGGATLKIGSFCSISSNVQIYLGGNHRSDWVTTSPLNVFFEQKNVTEHEKTKGDVIIGNDVWICGNATILSGVTIGHGAVIGNGAVVSRDVAPYSIVAGNPAKHIRYRFNPSVIEQLLAISWWNWPEETLRLHMDKILSSDISTFLKLAQAIQADK